MPMNPSDKQNKFLRCHYTTVQFGSSFFDVIGFQVQKLVPFQFGWIVIQNCVILKDSIKFMVVKRNSPLRFENVEHFGVVHESYTRSKMSVHRLVHSGSMFGHPCQEATVCFPYVFLSTSRTLYFVDDIGTLVRWNRVLG